MTETSISRYLCERCGQPCATMPEPDIRHSLWDYKSTCCSYSVTPREPIAALQAQLAAKDAEIVGLKPKIELLETIFGEAFDDMYAKAVKHPASYSWSKRVEELDAELATAGQRIMSLEGALRAPLAKRALDAEAKLTAAEERADELEQRLNHWQDEATRIETLRQQAEERATAPIPMLLECPTCGQAHVDEGEWATKPHRTHLCQHCGNEWRPSNRSTVGVLTLHPASTTEASRE